MEAMLYVNYQISTTFFNNDIKVKQNSDQLKNFHKADFLLRELEKEYIPYDCPYIWRKLHIFSVRILMTIDGKRYFDQTINIVQLNYLIQLDKINFKRQKVDDEFTQYRLLNIQKQLEKQFLEISTLTLEEFLAHKTNYLGDDNE